MGAHAVREGADWSLLPGVILKSVDVFTVQI